MESIDSRKNQIKGIKAGQFAKVLIIKPSSLGDVVHALPFLHAFKAAHPQAHIHWVIARGLEGLLEGHPLIDRLWIIDKDGWKKASRLGKTAKELAALRRGLKKERFDLVVDLQGLLRSALIARATGCPLRVGFQEAREASTLFYTRLVTGGTGIHAVDRYLKIADALGCPQVPVTFPFARHGPFLPECMEGLAPGSYAVLVPGARWVTKRWEPENFGQLAARFPFPSVIVGSPSDRPLAVRALARAANKARDLTGRTTLQELTAVIRHSRFMVTNDTGPMHIGAALNVPIFALFGPTDPALTGPYGKGHRIITSDKAKGCIACLQKKCDTMACLRDLSFHSVYEIISQSPELLHGHNGAH